MDDATDHRSVDPREHDVFARSRIPGHTRMTLLHIGAQHTWVLTGRDVQPDAALTLAIGSTKTADAFFRSDPPTPQELEAAIDTVEDEVMRARTLPADDATLVTADAALRDLAGVDATPTPHGKTWSLDAVEQMFQRLASASLGHPTALQGMPAGREAAAVLLIVREFMHHLGYESITVLDAADVTRDASHSAPR